MDQGDNNPLSGLRRFVEFERNLALLLILTPALLIGVDTGFDSVRRSISAYHDVCKPWAFYVPLTVGAMLFLVNGLVRNEHSYNTWLGVALGTVVLFDHDGCTAWPHYLGAGVFFLGNFYVMLFCSTHKSTRVTILALTGAVGAVVLWPLTSLFWAEWVSLAIVAIHYFLAAADRSPYEALKRGEKPKLTLGTSA